MTDMEFRARALEAMASYGRTCAVQTWEDVLELLRPLIHSLVETERTMTVAALQDWAQEERNKTPDGRIGDGSAQTFEEAAARIARKLHRG